MLPFERDGDMKRDIKQDEINKITAHCPIREKAFFTIIRQSGLTPLAIKQLRIKNVERVLEPDPPVPCKISISHEKCPTFMGQEAINYLKQYLNKRAKKENLTPESLLFTIRNNPNKEINTKDVSRAFRRAVQKLARANKITYEVRRGIPSELRLYRLVGFYKKNAKDYLKELSNDNTPKDDEVYRELYKEKAMPFLEIEAHITIEIYQLKKQHQKEIEKQNNQIKEMKQTITKDNEYISSILSLLYNNKGNPETGEAEKLGDHFIELWKKAKNEQRRNLGESWNRKAKLLPYKDILEQLTKTLERIIKPYKELKKTLKQTHQQQRRRNITPKG
jgi:Sec-independent protein translocase protein TatA